MFNVFVTAKYLMPEPFARPGMFKQEIFEYRVKDGEVLRFRGAFTEKVKTATGAPWEELMKDMRSLKERFPEFVVSKVNLQKVGMDSRDEFFPLVTAETTSSQEAAYAVADMHLTDRALEEIGMEITDLSRPFSYTRANGEDYTFSLEELSEVQSRITLLGQLIG